MLSKNIFYAVLFILLVLTTGFSTHANTLIPQIMLLLNSGDNGSQQETISATYDEVRLDMIRLE